MTAAAPAAPEPPAGFWSGLSDRLNPILVREVQQAVKGRMFALSVWLVLLVSVIIALVVVGGGGRSEEAGRGVFAAGLATLVPLLVFVVPMQAYNSMRLELRSGIVEQLLLSRLRPRSILAGKLLAAMVQFVLYVSILAPLLATSYLLRGVDLPTIVTSLGFALVVCVTSTAAAVSAAAQGTLPTLQSLSQVGAAFGFGMMTFALLTYVGSGEYVRDLGWLMRQAEFTAVVSALLLGAAATTVLSALVAQSFLLHAFENRSTGFRVYLFAVLFVALGWLVAFVEPNDRHDALAALVFCGVLLGLAFALFQWTEQKELSPRVRAHVPRRAGLALAVAPFLPGRDRAVPCLVLWLLLLGGLGALAWPVVHATTIVPGVTVSTFRFGTLRMAAMTAAYGVIYLSLAKWLRGRLPPTVGGNQVARFLLPVLLVLFCIAPALVDVFARGGVESWHAGHAMNPFWTIERTAFRVRQDEVLFGLLGVAALCLLLQVRSVFAGCAEVLDAAAARRAAAAVPPPPTLPTAESDA